MPGEAATAEQVNSYLNRNFELLRRFFVNKVKSEDEVKDLIQETMIACVESEARFAGRSSFRSFLLGIARHRVYKHWRKYRAEAQAIEEQSLVDLGAGPSSLLARDHRARRLLAALRSIPLKHQTILELYYWEELNGRELAEILQIPENTARTRLRAAKQNLGRVLRRLERFERIPETTDDDLEKWARRVRPECK